CQINVLNRIILHTFSFFFSSRRRHTRCLSDWSSDVCSSDLASQRAVAGAAGGVPVAGRLAVGRAHDRPGVPRRRGAAAGEHRLRSEERRVGEECVSVAATLLDKLKECYIVLMSYDNTITCDC